MKIVVKVTIETRIPIPSLVITVFQGDKPIGRSALPLDQLQQAINSAKRPIIELPTLDH